MNSKGNSEDKASEAAAAVSLDSYIMPGTSQTGVVSKKEYDAGTSLTVSG